MAEFERTDEFRGARFTLADLSGVVMRMCDVTGLRITASDVDDVRISGHAGEIGRVYVNDVEVGEYVAAELDRRYPERVQLRAVESADEVRAMWQVLEDLWSQTRARAERLGEALLHEGVDDEWSFIEVLRHLTFAIDVWLGRMINDVDFPFHPLGLPPSGYSDDGARDLGLERDAQPSYAEALDVYRGRAEQVRQFVSGVSDDDLAQLRSAAPAPEWDVETLPVGRCLHVILQEHCEHRRFAERDLAILESRQTSQVR